VIAVYVQRSWLQELGEIGESLVSWREATMPDHLMLLLAAEVHINFPFVEAKLVRLEKSDSGHFVSANIPADAVRGFFDLTRAQEKKYGFTRPKK
jgi:hypothetical protein